MYWPLRFGSRGLDTSPKYIDREGLGRRRMGTATSWVFSFSVLGSEVPQIKRKEWI